MLAERLETVDCEFADSFLSVSSPLIVTVTAGFVDFFDDGIVQRGENGINAIDFGVPADSRAASKECLPFSCRSVGRPTPFRAVSERLQPSSG